MKLTKYTRKTFSDMIIKRVRIDRSGEGYMSHIMEYCTSNCIPPEQIQYLISVELKEKLLVEGIGRRTLKGE